MKQKSRVASVTLRDCDIQCFCTGGPGGQNQNRNKNGIRIIHKCSGAIGESREYKSQYQNKRAAFIRMANTIKFKIWCMEMTGRETPEEYANREIGKKSHLKIEIKENGKWVIDNDNRNDKN